MAHPTRTGDLVVFAYPPYQFDAETPGTLIAPSHFFGQHGYVPDVQDLAANINMRATFLAGGTGIAKGTVTARSIDLAPTLAFMLGIPEPQHSQGRVLLDVVKGGNGYKPISIVGLNDFHGQLDPTTLVGDDGISSTVGGAVVPRHDVRRGVRAPRPGRADPRRRRQRRRLAAQLGPARGHADDRRRERCGASTPPRSATTSSTTASSGSWSTSSGRTSRSSRRTSSRTSTGELPDWLDAVGGVHRQRHQGRRHRRRARGHAGARLRRRHGGPRPSSPRRRGSRPSPSGSRRSASRSRSWSSTRGRRPARTRSADAPGVAVVRPDPRHRRRSSRTRPSTR